MVLWVFLFTSFYKSSGPFATYTNVFHSSLLCVRLHFHFTLISNKLFILLLLPITSLFRPISISFTSSVLTMYYFRLTKRRPPILQSCTTYESSYMFRFWHICFSCSFVLRCQTWVYNGLNTVFSQQHLIYFHPPLL
jgi:hypothetical protein